MFTIWLIHPIQGSRFREKTVERTPETGRGINPGTSKVENCIVIEMSERSVDTRNNVEESQHDDAEWKNSDKGPHSIVWFCLYYALENANSLTVMDILMTMDTGEDGIGETEGQSRG